MKTLKLNRENIVWIISLLFILLFFVAAGRSGSNGLDNTPDSSFNGIIYYILIVPFVL